MENLPDSIQEKLRQGQWGWKDLPVIRDDATVEKSAISRLLVMYQHITVDIYIIPLTFILYR
jgi:hypothetical protein